MVEEFGGAVDVNAGWKPSRPDTPSATGSPQGRPWKRRRARWGSRSPGRRAADGHRHHLLALQMPGPSGRRYRAAGDDVRSTALWMLGPRPPTPQVLTARFHLARMRGRSGDLAGAVAAVDQVLTHQQRVLGRQHPATLEAAKQLAA